MDSRISVSITSDPQLLAVVRAAVAKVCELAGYSDEVSQKIVLAVDEACTNVIKHAYKGRKGQPIDLEFRLGNRNLGITIQDHGEPAEKSKLKSRDLKEIRPGGLGVYLIKSTMDRVKYVTKPDSGNQLIMTKSLP